MIMNHAAITLLILLSFAAPFRSSAADKLRIGYGAPSVAMSVLWITKEGKLFEKNGLDVEVLYLERALVQRALIAGNIAFGEMTEQIPAAKSADPRDFIDTKFLEELDRSGHIDGLYR